MLRFSSPVSMVYAWNTWDHEPLLATKMLAFYDSGFPTEAQVKKQCFQQDPAPAWALVAILLWMANYQCFQLLKGGQGSPQDEVLMNLSYHCLAGDDQSGHLRGCQNDKV